MDEGRHCARFKEKHKAGMALAHFERRRPTSSNGKNSARADSASFADWDLENNEHFKELVQRAGLVDSIIDRDAAFLSTRLTAVPSNDNAKRLGHVRDLDTLSHSPKGVGRGMPPLIVSLFTVSAVMLLINPSDYVGEVKGILAVLVPLGLYWLSQRNKRKAKEFAQQHQTAEEAFKFSADKEKRLEERESKLRQEERDFMHTQISLSRRRGHILARGYMSMEMANDRLIELLRAHDIDIPPTLLTQQTRAQVLGELKEVEDEQAAMVEPKSGAS